MFSKRTFTTQWGSNLSAREGFSPVRKHADHNKIHPWEEVFLQELEWSIRQLKISLKMVWTLERQVRRLSSFMSNFLWPHGLQHSRFPCPSPTPRNCPNSCPLIQWCYPTISTLRRPLLFLPSIFPSTGFFSGESVLRIRWSEYWSFMTSYIMHVIS